MASVTESSVATLPAALRASGGQSLLFKRQVGQVLRNPTLMFGLVVLVVMLICAALAPVLAPEDPIGLKFGSRLRPPSAQHWFGTDDLGRDVLSRVIYGARVSLQVGALVVAIAGSIGFVLGATTGY